MQLHKKFGLNVEGVLIKNHQISCNNKKRRDVDCSKIKIFQELLCRIWQLLGTNSKYSNTWGHFFDRKQIYISVKQVFSIKLTSQNTIIFWQNLAVDFNLNETGIVRHIFVSFSEYMNVLEISIIQEYRLKPGSPKKILR